MRYGPFRAVLTAQARYLAPVVALATIATAVVPLLTLQGVSSGVSLRVDRVSILLNNARYFGPYYPAIAG
jgi:hypothetical protein